MPAKYTQVELVCENCGVTYHCHLSHALRSQRHFCGPECYDAARKLTPDRFWARADKNGPIHPYRFELGPCWVWTGATFDAGYGMVTVSRKTQLAHRVAYTLAKGNIADGLLICHSCDNPSCINPAHLFAGTDAENSADMTAKGRAVRMVGERNVRSKLTDSDVRAIRSRYAEGGILQRDLADQYGVTFQTISAIVRRNDWKHVE